MKKNTFNCFVKEGNKKLSNKILIFNMDSSKECMSRKLGLCEIGSKCYELGLENYPNVIKHHQQQKEYWDTHSKEFLAKKFLLYSEFSDIEFIRFNESGDFKNQEDVDKLVYIANYLLNNNSNIIIYGYTHRKDLNFDKRPKNLIINGSGFMLDNNFKVTTNPSNIDCIAYEMKVINKELKKNEIKPIIGFCGDKCKLCMTKNNKVIYEMLH